MKKIIELIKEYNNLRNTQLKLNAELEEQTSQLVIDLLRKELKEINNKILNFENMELYTKEEYNSNIKYIETNNYQNSRIHGYPNNSYCEGYDWDNKNEW